MTSRNQSFGTADDYAMDGFTSPPPSYGETFHSGGESSSDGDKPSPLPPSVPTANPTFYPQPPSTAWMAGQPSSATDVYPGRPLQAGYHPTTTFGLGFRPPPQYIGYSPPSYQQQQQQQQAVVVIGPNGQSGTPQYVESFVGHVVLACFVTWICNFIMGIIAFVLATTATRTAVSDPRGANQLGRASYAVSVAGIVMTVVIVTLVVSIVVGTPKDVCNGYQANGRCFNHYSASYTSTYCVQILNGYYQTNGFCYYN